MNINQSQPTNNEFLSLYEYLGKPAGTDLGKLVAKRAYELKIPMSSHHISNIKYTGNIIKYPKQFLDTYFKVDKDDNLPF